MLSQRLVDAIDNLGQRQAGQIARWQLLRLGLTFDQADALPGRLGWTPSSHGVSRLPGTSWEELSRAWAAVLAAVNGAHGGPSAVGDARDWAHVHHLACTARGTTGFTAAWLHELTDNAPTRPQLLLPHDARCLLTDLQVIRTRAPLGDLQLVQDVPTVGILRLLFDCGQLLHRSGGGVGQMRRLMSRADGRRLVLAKDLHHVVRDPAAFGLPRTVPPPFRAAAIGLAGGHSHSAVESMGRRIVTEVAASLGLAVEPRPLALPDERSPVAEADIAIPLLRLDIEVDGPHHDEPAQQRIDRWRDDKVVMLGWTVRRYRSSLVEEDPERFRRLVTADILQAAAALGIVLGAAA